MHTKDTKGEQLDKALVPFFSESVGMHLSWAETIMKQHFTNQSTDKWYAMNIHGSDRLSSFCTELRSQLVLNPGIRSIQELLRGNQC